MALREDLLESTLKFISKFIFSVKVTLLCNKALLYEFHGNHAEANIFFKKIFNLYKNSNLSSDIPAYLNLLYARNLSKINKHESYKVCLIAINQLKAIKVNYRYKYSDILYLQYFCKKLLYSLTNFVDSEAFEEMLKINITYSQVEITKVSKRLLRKFPLNYRDCIEFDKYVNKLISGDIV